MFEYKNMNAVDHFKRLFAYDAWANQEVLAGLRAAAQAPARSAEFIAHLLAAERLWLDRIEQRQPAVRVWPEFTLQQCETMAADLSQLWKGYLDATSEGDLAKLVDYQNSKGENWKSRIDDILMHVITHSAYHRGQIAANMRSAGMKPAYTDFIHSVRQGFVE